MTTTVAVTPGEDAEPDLKKNQDRRDLEARCYTTLEQANIPLTTFEIARRARVTVHQARRALSVLVADGKIREIWAERRDAYAFVLAGAA